jgi:hypothetical protein
LLIDAKHRSWIRVSAVVTVLALAVYFVCVWLTPSDVGGGSTVGLWYGTIGTVLMLCAGALSLHRRLLTRRWVGRRSGWLRGHIWLGSLSGVFLACHCHGRLGGPLTTSLSLVTIAVLLTGWIGLSLQHRLPRHLTSRILAEAPYEQIPHLCEGMRREADLLVDVICGPVEDQAAAIESTRLAADLVEDGKAQLRGFYETDVRPFLANQPPADSPMLNPIQTDARFAKLRKLDGLDEQQERLDKLANLCSERRQLLEQQRIHFWLHSWLLLHIPLSVAILILGAAHIATALYH